MKVDEEVKDIRSEYLELLHEAREKGKVEGKEISEENLLEGVHLKLLQRAPKSRAYYRMESTRRMLCSAQLITHENFERALNVVQAEAPAIEEKTDITEGNKEYVFLDPCMIRS